MLNTVVIMGRLTADPEVRTTQSGKTVAGFTLAADRDYQPSGAEKQADFIDCTAWDKKAEFVCKYFAKGRMAIVKGRLETDTYTDKDGNKRKSVKVIAENIYFGDSKPIDNKASESIDGDAVSNFSQLKDRIIADNPDGFTEISNDDLPF